MKLRQAELLMALTVVGDYELRTANELAMEMAPVNAFGVRSQLDQVNRIMERIHQGVAEPTTEQARIGALTYIVAPKEEPKPEAKPATGTQPAPQTNDNPLGRLHGQGA